LSGYAKLMRQEPVGIASLLFLVVVCLLAALAPQVSPHGPTSIVAEPLLGPNSEYWLGTDQFGRDVYSRIIYGARLSLAAGLVATLAAALGATVLGVFGAYVGGWSDLIIQRVVDALQAIPPIVFLIGLVVALEPSFGTIVLALAVRGAFVLSRVVRGTALTIKDQQFVESARAIGASGSRIMVRHLVPNVVPILIVLFSVNVSSNILAEASLSFLGYGVQPPTPTLGGMMSGDSRLYMIVAPWLLIAPVIVLALIVLAFNMSGDMIRDRIDPRLRGR
jgi:peptide/nickel transport system permease protein